MDFLLKMMGWSVSQQCDSSDKAQTGWEYDTTTHKLSATAANQLVRLYRDFPLKWPHRRENYRKSVQ